MSAISIPMLPDSAPFTPSQRAWLNGFFAGIFGRAATAQASPGVSAATSVAVAPASPVVEEEEDYPWHDSALGMDERLKLAEGKPRERVMMAAMAQLDCGACGYLCKTYSEAIAIGEEKDLTKCAPGGRDTSRKLKELVAAGGGTVVPVADVRVKTAAAPAAKFGRHNPFPARLLKCENLSKPGSAKETRFVALDLKGSGVSYRVGDSLGVLPENCPDTIGWILEALNASGAESVDTPGGVRVTLHEALLKHYSLGKPTDLMLELLINSATDPIESAQLKELLAADGCSDGEEVLDLLQRFPSAQPEPEEFITALSPIQPRLYSISSSMKAHPDEVHLTVATVRYLNGRGRQCKGVASTFFAERMRPGQKVRVFVQQSHGFSVPENPDAPLIMVGPGTGIAPFRAFLEERKAMGAKGRNWLFFGDQRSDFDFLYREELEQHRRDGSLTRLDTAFSRDSAAKVYVQQRMIENGSELWSWIQAGAHFCVCGDAKRMANDVDEALKAILAEHGKMTADEAKAYVAQLAKSKRYLRDVY